jgi:hypothetical protein
LIGQIIALQDQAILLGKPFSIPLYEHFPEKNISRKGRDDKYGKCNLNYA